MFEIVDTVTLAIVTTEWLAVAVYLIWILLPTGP